MYPKLKYLIARKKDLVEIQLSCLDTLLHRTNIAVDIVYLLRLSPTTECLFPRVLARTVLRRAFDWPELRVVPSIRPLDRIAHRVDVP